METGGGTILLSRKGWWEGANSTVTAFLNTNDGRLCVFAKQQMQAQV
jgi:hypothetical protein